MGPAVGIRNGIGKRQDLVVVAVVVLQDDIDKNFVALARDYDRLGMKHLFVFTQLLHELFNAVFVEKCFFFGESSPLVRQVYFQPRVEKGELAQSGGQSLKLKLGRNRKDLSIR